MNVLLILLCYSIAYTSDKREVAADHKDAAARRSGSAKDIAARKSAMLSRSSAKEVAAHLIQGKGQKSSPAKAVAVYRRNWAGQKTQSVHLSSSTKKVGNYRRDVAAQRSGSAKEVTTRKSAMLSSSSAKDVANYRIQKEGQRSSPAKTVAAYRRNWGGQKTQSAHLSSSTKKVENYRLDGAAQKSASVKNIGFKQKGLNLERVERVAALYREDTRYRIATILMKLDEICIQMTRKQTYIRHKLVLNPYKDKYNLLQRTYPVRKVLAFYTDMLRQNIDVTYAVEFVFRLYKEKAIEREAAEEGKRQRKKLKEAADKKGR